jgi:hypothetical protein
MATTYPTHAAAMPATESEVVHGSYSMLKFLFGVVPIVAGADKFTNFLAHWEDYLNPMIPQILHMTPHNFMLIVGVIEIIAGIIVFAKPRFGGFLVMAWLIGIALQLILWGHFLDIAVRDLVMALGGALTLARLAPFEQHRITTTTT